MSLTGCMQKAGAAISDENKSAVFAAAREYIKQGTPVDEAGRMAIRERIAALNEQIAALTSGQTTGGPDVKPKDKPEPKPPKQPRIKKVKDNTAEMVEDSDIHGLADAIYNGIREVAEDDLPVIFPEDKMIRLQVKLTERTDVEASLKKLGFRITDRAQEEAKAERVSISALYRPEGKTIGDTGEIGGIRKDPPVAEKPKDKADAEKAVDKLLADLHPKNFLNPDSNADNSFGAMMFKEAIFSGAKLPLAYLSERVTMAHRGMYGWTDRAILESALDDDAKRSTLNKAIADYSGRLQLLQTTVAEHAKVDDVLAAFRTKYAQEDRNERWNDSDGTRLMAIYSNSLKDITRWGELFGGAAEDSTDQTHRVKKKDPDRPPGMFLQNIIRTGMKDHRGGKDVADENAFKSAFGFSDVVFGNWVTQSERQISVNLGYDSLMDLAQLLGMPAKHIGEGGKLAMAFGAAGRGGKAAAHFDPANGLINLTKTKGDGTVSHEWFHSFDHNLPRLQTDSNDSSAARRLVTSLAEALTKQQRPEVIDGMLRDTLSGAGEIGNRNVPPKDAVLKAVFGTGRRYDTTKIHNSYQGATETKFQRDADAMDGGGKRYWGSPVEMLARGFETFIYDKTKGGSPYLVGPTRADGFMTAKNGYEGTPYPIGDERKYVADLYQHFLDQIDPETLQVKRITPKMKIIALPEIGFAVMDQNGLDYTNAFDSYKVKLYETRDDAQAAIENAERGAQPYVLTFDLVATGKRNQEGIKFLTRLDAIMEEMGIFKWPEIKNGSLSESMFFHMRQGWFPKNLKDLKDYASKAYKVEPTELDGLKMKMVEESFEAALARFSAQVIVDMRAQGSDPKAIYDKLVEMYQSQPNLLEKTATQMRNQAYSTPIPIAFVAGSLARVTHTDKVGDVTGGGNGLLAITANPKNLTAIELDPRRANHLRLMQVGTVYEGDALSLIDEKIKDQQFDSVLFNPPFGAAESPVDVESWNGKKYRMRKIDQILAAKGLRGLKDDGRGTIILGAHPEAGKVTDGDLPFLNWLYSNYHVADHFEVAGDMYSRQGATWPIRVLIVAGRKQTNGYYDGKPVRRIADWQELWSYHDEAIQRSREVMVGAGEQSGIPGSGNQQPGAVPGSNPGEGDAAGGSGGRGSGATDPTGAGGNRSPRPSGAGNSGGVSSGNGTQGGTGVDDGGAGRPGDGATGQPRGRRTSPGTASGPDAGGLSGVGDIDVDDLLNGIFGPDEEPEPVARPKKTRGKSTGATTAGTPRAPKANPSPALQTGARERSPLDDIPGMSGILDDLAGIMGGALPGGPLLSDNEANLPDPEPPTDPTPSGGKKKSETPTADTKAAGVAPSVESREAARAQYMPADFLEIINRQRALAQVWERDIGRARDTLTELRDNPTAAYEKRAMFSRNLNEQQDDQYAKVLPVFIRAWDAISQAVQGMKERLTAFGQGMLKAFGRPIKALVGRFMNSIIADQKAKDDSKKKKPIITDHGDTETQVVYRGLSGGFSGGVYVARSQAQAMQRAFTEFETKHGDIDKFVASQLGYTSVEQMHGSGSQGLGGYQIDAIGLAISKMMEGKGFIIGDDTGVGKGRTAAAIITWAAKQGKVPVFITVNKTLYSDMWGDMRDISMRSEEILMTDTDAAIVDKNDGNKPIMRARNSKSDLQHVIANAGLPAGKKFLFTTYHQLNTENPRRQALRELVKAGKAVLVMDESHNMASGAKAQRGKQTTSEFMLSLLTGQDLFGSGVMPGEDWKPPMTTYLSATFAKRPGNMPAYNRTDLQWAANSPEDLVNLFTGGGDTLLKVTSEMLVESGSMIRRERSYIGVKFEFSTDEANAPRDSRLIDSVTKVLRQIVNADRAMKEWMKTAEGMDAVTNYIQQTHPGTRPTSGLSLDKVTEKAEFSSVVHNYTGQLLLATKIDRAVEMAVAALNRGEKPVLTLQNTMEAPLEDYAEQNSIKNGDEMPDFGWQSVLSRGTRSAQRVRINMGTGNPDDNPKIEIPTWVMAPLVAREFERAVELVSKFQSPLPVSPIDAIKHKLSQYWVVPNLDGSFTVTRTGKGFQGARPLKAEEITGRGLMVDYSGDLPRMENRHKPPANDVISSFQDGGIDVVILNSSASTGISLHASERAKDQRPRRMFILQPNPDIAVFKQMIGRIHRTGQVEWPAFTVMATGVPAENRVAAVLNKKLSTLFSNTSAGKGSTTVDAVDFINEYGDKIVEKYLEDNPDILALMGIKTDGDDLALRASGKAALLSVEDQEAFYSTVIQEFLDEIETRNATGTNALDRRELPLDAFTDDESVERVLEMGLDEANPFTASAYLTSYNVSIIGDIPTPDKVRFAVEQALGGRNKEKWLADLTDSIKVAYDEALNQTQLDINQLAAEIAAPGKTDQELQKLASQKLGAEQRLRDFSGRRDRTISALRQRFYPGAQLETLRFGDTDANAVVSGVSYRPPAAKKGNPFAPSNFKISFIRNIPNGRVSLSLAKLETARSDGDVDVSGRVEYGDQIDRWFSLRSVSGGREHRWIATGNLLRARAALMAMGTNGGEIVRFTKRGEALPVGGIQMSPTFQPTTNTQDVTVRFHEVAADYLLLLAEMRSKSAAERYGDSYQEAHDAVKAAIKYRTEITAEVGTQIGNKALWGPASAWRIDIDPYSGRIHLLVVGDKNGAALAKRKDVNEALGGDSNEMVKRNRNDRFYVHPRGLTPDEARALVRVLGNLGAMTAPADAEQAINELSKQHFTSRDTRPDGLGGAPQASRSAARKPGNGQPAAKVQALVSAITARWKNAPRVVVVQSITDKAIPESVRKEAAGMQSKGTAGAPEGFYNPEDNTVYLIADKLNGDADTVRVLMHESLGHYGMRGVYGAEFGNMLDRLATLNSGKVRAAAVRLGYDFEKQSERRMAAEEVLAYMAQNTPELGWVQRAVAAIRTWARENIPGFSKMGLSEAEIIRDFILPARQFVTGGPDGSGGGKSGPTGDRPMASRSLGEALTAGMNSVREVKLPAGYLAGDFMDGTPGKVHWWHKSVGTMYHLAQKSPAFKLVYDGIQNFLNDVSYYATEAADLAPRILPKLDKFSDVWKSPLSPEDTKAISAPIFEGTLSWGRDANGKARPIDEIVEELGAQSLDDKAHLLMRKKLIDPKVLRMWQGLPMEQYEKIIEGKFEREFLKPGVVFTPAELKEHFKLTDQQVGLYKEFRAATDKSITHLAITGMLKFGGKAVAPIRDKVLATNDIGKAGILLRDKLFELGDDDAGNKMVEKMGRAQELIDKGYAPLSRFGQYTLDVMDGTDRVYFGLFESPSERAKMARKMKAQFPDAVINQGTVSEEAYKLFAGVNPDTVELLGEMLGLDPTGDEAKDKAFQTYLQVAKSSRDSMKRLIKRKGIAGFSEDAGRVLAGFVYSNARQTASNLHMGSIDKAVNEIPQGDGQLQDVAVKLREYVKNPAEEAQAFRAVLFAQYLGGSIASAMVNATQPFAVTFPYLSQFGGITKAARQMAAAVKDATKNSTGDKALDAALKKAEEEGIVSPQEVHSLMAQAMGKAQLESGDGTTAGNALAAANNGLSKLSLAWGKVFGVAEQFNRRTTFIAAYRTAVEQNIADPAGFAAKAIAETQFTYNKGNKPRWARGLAGSILFTFKQYSVNYVELLVRMGTAGKPGSEERKAGQRAALLALAVLFLLSGADGLPFAEDIQDVIDAALQRMGYNVRTKQAMKELLASELGQGGADFVMNGLTGIPGVPIDLSGRLGMGNLIPGTGLFQKKADHSRDLMELAGPAGDLVKRGFAAADQAISGDVGKAITTISPVAARNVVKGIDMADMGMYRDDQGRKIIDTTPGEALAKSIGFQPQTVKNVQDAGREVQRSKATYQLAAAEIREKWALAIFESDKDALQSARERLAAWNRQNPEQRMTVNMPAVLRRVQEMRKTKAQRIADSAPKTIREQARKQLEEELK